MTASPPWYRRLVLFAGLAACGVFLVLIARFWHPVYGFTALIQLDASNDNLKLNAFRELPVYVYRDNGGYDGLYYAQLALDPTLRDPQFPTAIDSLGIRARRILTPALAWLLGAGRPAWIVQIYPMLNIGAWLVLAVLLWRLLAVETLRGWLAWSGVMFSAGALGSVRLALTDLVALAILAGAMFAAERGRNKTALGAVAAAGLARETSLLAFAGLIRRPWWSWHNFRRGLVAVAPLLLWLGYVRWRTGPTDAGWANFTLPGTGLAEKWSAAFGATQTLNDKLLAWTTALATLGLTAQALYVILNPALGERWWWTGAAYAGLMLFLGPAVWEGFPGAATRVLLPLTLAFNVLAHRLRAPVTWLVIGNLGVFAGLLALRDIPFDSQEFAAVHAGGISVVARPGEDWFPVERHGRQTWRWTGVHGTMQFEAWPRGQPASLQLDFTLNSLVPCTVTVRQDGREIGRAEVGPARSHHHLTVLIGPGHDTIEFSTDTPGKLENANADARTLAFAISDVRLAGPESSR